MDDELRSRIEEAAEVNALRNALEYEGAAEVGAIMGPLMGEHPDFREHADAVSGIVGGVVEEVNELEPAAQRSRLETLAPDALAALEAPDEADEHELPALPTVSEDDTVRMRCAPNPNGPWHVGHARMPAVIGTYRDRYDGWFCVRFDDTDPETKRPDLAAYDWILEDLEYLGFEPDDVVRASDRMELYYERARALIERGGAYTCDLSAERFSSLKNAGEPSPNRDKDPATTHDEFEGMIDGEYSAGEMTLRVRTDITHPNPALRDWVAFRMIDTPHPRDTAADYRCWPTLDFQSGIDDHALEITHIIRGIDLQDSAKRQQFLYDYFDWSYPEVVHWGHVQLNAYDVAMSTSTIRDRIEAGDLEGWDDPRAPTLRSLRRRGIQGAAITEAMIGLGTSTNDVDLSMSAIYAANRELIDREADRRFLVRDGIEVPIGGAPPTTADPPRHPEADRGTRTISLGDTVLIETEDRPGREQRVWLKGLGCFRYTRDALQYTGEDIEVVRSEGVPVIHWVPAAEAVPVTLRTIEGDERGMAEPGVLDHDPDDLVQFERVGFARIDAVENGELVAYYAHP